MKIQCDNCHATYDVAESAIPPEGREVQCAKCDHVWLQMPIAAQPAAESGPLTLTEDINAPQAEGMSQAPLAHDVGAFDNPNQGFDEVEATEFHSYRAESLPDTNAVSPNFDADVLEDEAQFAREQRELVEPPAQVALDETTGSPLEALRRRVISDTPAVPEMPTENTDFTQESTPEMDSPAEAQPVEDTLDAEPAAVEMTAEADPIVFDPDQPEKASASEEVAEDVTEVAAEPAEEKPAASPFRRLGAALRNEPAVTSDPIAPEADASGDITSQPEDVKIDSSDAPENSSPADSVPAAPEPAAKRRRQSLAEISASGVLPSENREPPAEKPFDLGPATPEELPEQPIETEGFTKPVNLPQSAPIAKPDMSPEAIARRAMEELDAVEVRGEKSNRSLAGGFAIGLLIITFLIFFYSFGPVIGEAVPATAAFFEVYIRGFDRIFDAIGLDLSGIGRSIAGLLEAI